MVDALPAIAPKAPTTGEASLVPGRAFVARVMADTDGVLLRLMTAQGTLTLPRAEATAKALTPGTLVRVEVSGAAARPLVTLTALPAQAATPGAPVAGGLALPAEGAPAASRAGGAPAPAPATPPAGPLAGARSGPGPTPPAQAITPATPGPANLGAALGDVAARGQSALGPALATIAAAADAPDPALPAPVRAAVAEVAARVLPLDTAPTARAVQAAVQASGVFRDARLAAGVPMPGAPDLKSSLLDLAKSLALVMPRPATEARERPEAPRRGAPPTAQAPTMVPEILAAGGVGEQALKQAAEGALDRLRLLQLASRGERIDGAPPAAQSAPTLHVELPWRLGEQMGVVALAIERDREEEKREARRGRHGRVWRLQFGMDIEPLGPIHGEVKLVGLEATIGLWAERAETTRAFLDASGELKAALAEVSLEVGDIAMRKGQPPARPERLAHVDVDA